MNAGEYGIVHNHNLNFNVSGFTTLSITYTRPDGTTFTVTNPDVTAPAVPLVTDDAGTFAANQYTAYTFVAGNITVEGVYTFRVTYTDGSKLLKDDTASFTVNP